MLKTVGWDQESSTHPSPAWLWLSVACPGPGRPCYGMHTCFQEVARKDAYQKEFGKNRGRTSLSWPKCLLLPVASRTQDFSTMHYSLCRAQQQQQAVVDHQSQTHRAEEHPTTRQETPVTGGWPLCWQAQPVWKAQDLSPAGLTLNLVLTHSTSSCPAPPPLLPSRPALPHGVSKSL